MLICRESARARERERDKKSEGQRERERRGLEAAPYWHYCGTGQMPTELKHVRQTELNYSMLANERAQS